MSKARMARAVLGSAALGSAALAAAMAGSAALPATVEAQERERERRPVQVYEWHRGPPESFVVGPRLGVYLDEAVIARLEPGGAAEEAGLLENDVIVAIGGHLLVEPLEEEEEWARPRRRAGRAEIRVSFEWSAARRIRALLGKVPEGEAVEVLVERDGEELALSVVPRRPTWSVDLEHAMDTLRVHMEDFRERADVYGQQIREYVDGLRVNQGDGWSVFAFDDYSTMGGLDLVPLNPGLGSYFGTEEGVLVIDVERGSPLNLRPGDVVAAVDGRAVDDLRQLRRILRSYTDGEEIEFTVWRDGSRTTVAGEMGG